jgi:hypothetical protein
MKKLSSLSMTRAALLSLAVIASEHDASAQQKTLRDQLIGTWTFVSSSSKRDDGSATWGPNSKGLLIMTDNGRFSLQIMRTDRPKYKSETRMKGTLIENQATSRGTISYFGAFAVAEPDRMLTFHIESSTFPNLNGTEQKRVFTLANDELKYENPSPRRAGPPTVFDWKRLK